MRALLAVVATTLLTAVLLVSYRVPNTPGDRAFQRGQIVDPRGATRDGGCERGGDGRTATVGPSVAWPLGHVRVRAVLVGCRIDDVTVVDMKTTNAYSQRRAAGAAALLRGEVIAKQCVNIDAVSGATFTSEAYKRSLQAAIDGVRAGKRC